MKKYFIFFSFIFITSCSQLVDMHIESTILGNWYSDTTLYDKDGSTKRYISFISSLPNNIDKEERQTLLSKKIKGHNYVFSVTNTNISERFVDNGILYNKALGYDEWLHFITIDGVLVSDVEKEDKLFNLVKSNFSLDNCALILGCTWAYEIISINSDLLIAAYAELNNDDRGDSVTYKKTDKSFFDLMVEKPKK